MQARVKTERQSAAGKRYPDGAGKKSKETARLKNKASKSTRSVERQTQGKKEDTLGREGQQGTGEPHQDGQKRREKYNERKYKAKYDT